MSKRNEKDKRPKPVWIDLGNGRKLLVMGQRAKAVEKQPKHSGVRLYPTGCLPQQVPEMRRRADEAGFRAIRFNDKGHCFADSRREAVEYVHHRTGEVMLDGGYYETISDRRSRQLRGQES